jgi:hypothetical protein
MGCMYLGLSVELAVLKNAWHMLHMDMQEDTCEFRNGPAGSPVARTNARVYALTHG